MQLAMRPNAAFHSGVFFLELNGFEPDHERGNHFARIGRKNRHGYYLVDGSVPGLGIFKDVTDLLLIRQFAQGKLRFSVAVQLSNVVRIQRLDDCACAVEETIKFRMKPLCCLRGRWFLAFH